MKEPSASLLALAEHCLHPWTSGIRWPEDRSPAGDLGKRVHRTVEGSERGWPVFPAVLAGLTEAERRSLGLCVEQARDYLDMQRPPWGAVPMSTATELWIRYHVPTGKARIGERGERKREPGWWTAILDYVEVHPGGRVVVRDWKTGRQEHTTDARSNPQLRLQAIAAASFYGATHVRVELVYLGGRDVEVDAAEFGPFDLAMIAADLRDLRAGLLGGPTPPVPGPHCVDRFCPLRGICSATRAALASAYPLEEPLSPTPRDEAHARWIFERLPGARAALEAVEAGLEEFARHTPVSLADGRVFAWREQVRREVHVDTHEQREALAQVLGGAPWTLRYKTSIEAIEAAARAKLAAQGEKRGISALTKQALAALDKVGGVKLNTYTKAEAFKVKEEGSR